MTPDISKLQQCAEKGHKPIRAMVRKTFAAKIAVPFESDSGLILNACGRCGLLYVENPK